ncbi:MAG TPA: hypothetical protein VK808_11600 [Bacteroidia bacterium]|jgi:hypothetical protein|nr:hypothetical protein [Bacteroidia bacterium]
MVTNIDYIRQIKIIMAAENIQQAQLVSIWKISRQQVSSIMTGKAELSVKRYYQFLNHYNYSIDISKKEK